MGKPVDLARLPWNLGRIVVKMTITRPRSRWKLTHLDNDWIQLCTAGAGLHVDRESSGIPSLIIGVECTDLGNSPECQGRELVG